RVDDLRQRAVQVDGEDALGVLDGHLGPVGGQHGRGQLRFGRLLHGDGVALGRGDGARPAVRRGVGAAHGHAGRPDAASGEQQRAAQRGGGDQPHPPPGIAAPARAGSAGAAPADAAPGRRGHAAAPDGAAAFLRRRGTSSAPAATTAAPAPAAAHAHMGTPPSSSNVTGTLTSCDLSDPRVWSALVTTAPRTSVQSTESDSSGVTRISTSNVPPGPYGTASPFPYGGGFEDTHCDAPPLPDVSAPPPQGEGALSGPLSRQSAT